MKHPPLPLPIETQNFNTARKLIFNICKEDFEYFRNLRFGMKKINPCETTIIINESNKIFIIGDESSMNLFISCPYASNVWNTILSKFNAAGNMGDSLLNHLLYFLSSNNLSDGDDPP